MKTIIIVILLMLTLIASQSFAGDIRLGFAWNPNTEPDVKEYEVYRRLGATPNPATDQSICKVQHPTVQCLNNLIGSFTDQGTLWFYAVARDGAIPTPNQSGPSLPVSWNYDFLPPAPPGSFKIVEILGVNSLIFLYQGTITIS